MIGELLSSTNILSFNTLSAQELAKICRLAVNKVENLKVAFIVDKRPFELRDNLIKDFSSIYNTTTFDKVYPDPKTSDINDMFVSLRNQSKSADKDIVDVIIGIGGGSTLDSAKALALLSAHSTGKEEHLKLDDFLGANPSRKIEKKSVPLILIPTTAGTGSEVTKVGVYTSETGRKYTLGSPLMQAQIALLIAEFTADLPSTLTASTGFDALSHALESIWNKNATDITIEVAEDAAVKILEQFEKAYDLSVKIEDVAKTDSAKAKELAYSKETLELRKEMLNAACLAGVAFSITGTASVHALSFILSEEWHIPHGTACAFTLEDVYKMNKEDPEVAKRLSHLAKKAFGNSATSEILLEEIIRLKKKMKQPCNFSDINVILSKKEIEEKFDRSFSDPKMLNNKPAVKKEIIFNLLEDKV